MVNLPCAQNDCSPMISTIHKKSRNIHCRSCPVVSFLQGIKAWKVMQHAVFVSQVVQPPTTPVTFFSVEIDDTKEPQGMMPPWRRRASFDVTRHSTMFESLRHRRGAQRSGIFSRFSSQVVPIVNDAIGVGITELPRGVATDTRCQKIPERVWHIPVSDQ